MAREPPLDLVTGAFGYTGRYIATRLLQQGHRLRTFTRRPDRPSPFVDAVEALGWAFDDPLELSRRLEGVTTLYNTYWVRFPYGGANYELAVENSRALFAAAKRAGVERLVHVSITNPSAASHLGYFRGKALVERALAETGLPFAVVRPTVVFGPGDVLVNNIAWFLRRLPAFAIAGSGDYRVRPVHVDDVARLCVESGARTDDVIIDAVGPETLTFEEMVELVRRAVDSRSLLVHVPSPVVAVLAGVLGLLTRDVVLTADELEGLMAELVTTDGPSTGEIRFSEWVEAHSAALGAAYANELERHFPH